MDKIFTGLDRAQELGFYTYRSFVEKLAEAFHHVPNWGAVDEQSPLQAFVSHGRWLAECECGENYYVEPADPVGYCPTCGNLVIGGKARPVLFPINRLVIEQALLERETEGDPGTIRRLGTQAHLFTKLVHPKVMPRHWDGETVDELRAQHKKVGEILKEIRKQKQEVPHWDFKPEQLEQMVKRGK